ncbi:ring finger protein-like [Rhineura floridana]|uniref:ring finger protein-like n=1 Tax=Rhineura floridana TaxID=261503 RepID=UPI002AC84863|nr:ring finger protein-like [Rhineura floridana]
MAGLLPWHGSAEDRGCRPARASPYREAAAEIRMGTPLPDAERALGPEPVPAADLEEEEEAGLEGAAPPGTLSPDLGLLEMEEDGGGEGEVARAVPMVLFKDGLAPWRSAEEQSPSWAVGRRQEEQPGEPCKGPGESPAICCPDPACVSSADREEDSIFLAPTELDEGSYSTQMGEEEEVGEVCPLQSTCLAPEEAVAALSCCVQAEDPSGDEQECPICTELYDHDRHKPALLNCSHILCGQCLHAIMEAASAADIGRVRCPICRQKTPMMEWEICKLQEELLLLSSTQGPALGPQAFHPLPARHPGVWGGLEHHFQVRFHTSRMIGFLPCLRYPPCLISGLARLERRCHGCYRLALVALLGVEMLSLLLVFLPIILLLLLFLILDK